MKLRPLLENPFRNYAVFAGRARRAEFWLFILTFVVITQLAWVLGFGVMKIAGFDNGHDGSSAQHLMGQSDYDDAATGETAGEQSGDDSSVDDDADDAGTGAKPDRRDPSSVIFGSVISGKYPSDRHDDDMMNFMIHRHGRDGYHLHGIIRDDHMFEYDDEDLDGSDHHRRHEYSGGQRDRHVYVRFHESRAERGGDTVWLIAVAGLLLPLFSVGARRLHDSSHSGWWQLLALIPVAGWLVLLIFFLLPGDEDENRFGPPSVI